MGKIRITASIIMLAITTAFLFTMQACTMSEATGDTPPITESKPPTTAATTQEQTTPHGADGANIIQDSSYDLEPMNIIPEPPPDDDSYIKFKILEDNAVDGVYRQFLLTVGDTEIYIDGMLSHNRSEEIVTADLTGDGVEDIIVMLTKYTGTGVSVPEIHIFDGVTLEKYEVIDAVDIATEQLTASGDDDYFYVISDDDTLIIDKSVIGAARENQPEQPGWGSIYYYAVYENNLYAQVLNQVSFSEFYGTVLIKYEFDDNKFIFNSVELTHESTMYDGFDTYMAKK